LIGSLRECEEQRAEHVGRRLVAREQQQHGDEEHLVVAEPPVLGVSCQPTKNGVLAE
jgi:hypothetical protein